MRIDLSREITMQFLDELDDFLAMTRLGETWSEKLYGLRDARRYVRPFLEQTLGDVQMFHDIAPDSDWWECAIESVEYFREKFRVTCPIELVRDAPSCHDRNVGNLAYACCYEVTGTEPVIYSSEIAVQNLSAFVNNTPPINQLIGGIAHEVWHAYQHQLARNFLCMTDNVVDLEQIDPTDDKNRGAIYALSNMILYRQPCCRNDSLYRFQICEAEAYYIQDKITAVLM